MCYWKVQFINPGKLETKQGCQKCQCCMCNIFLCLKKQQLVFTYTNVHLDSRDMM